MASIKSFGQLFTLSNNIFSLSSSTQQQMNYESVTATSNVNPSTQWSLLQANQANYYVPSTLGATNNGMIKYLTNTQAPTTINVCQGDIGSTSTFNFALASNATAKLGFFNRWYKL